MKHLYLLLDRGYYLSVKRPSTEFVTVSAFHNESHTGWTVTNKTFEGATEALVERFKQLNHQQMWVVAKP